MLHATLHRFVRCDRGATAIEYGLIAALVGIGIIASLGNVRDGFATTANQAINGLSGR
jgi:pilus assembly protein Flp/PilA